MIHTHPSGMTCLHTKTRHSDTYLRKGRWSNSRGIRKAHKQLEIVLTFKAVRSISSSEQFTDGGIWCAILSPQNTKNYVPRLLRISK